MSIFESVLSGFFFKRIYKSVLYENDEDFEKNTVVLYVSQKGILTYFIFGL